MSGLKKISANIGVLKKNGDGVADAKVVIEGFKKKQLVSFIQKNKYIKSNVNM